MIELPDWAVISICIVVFLSHAWVMGMHGFRLGTDPGDAAKDPMYRRDKALLGFLGLIIVQLIAMWRRICIAIGNWTPEGHFEHLLDDFSVLPTRENFLLMGALFFFSGLVLRVHAIDILGRYFTYEIGIRSEHKIIEEGPYRRIRHPGYTGMLLMLLGMGLVYASLPALVLMVGGTFHFLRIRMKQEEAMLLEHFGDAYSAYQRRTKRLIPFIY